jgi:hypothetical protein
MAPEPRDSIFDIAAFLIASARDAVEAPPVYGAFRMLDAAGRVAALAPGDAFLSELANRIEQHKRLVLESHGEYVRELDDVLIAVAAEAKRRNLRL